MQAVQLTPDMYQPKAPEKHDYRIGILGCGGIVRGAHLPAYGSFGYQVVAACDLTEDNVKDARPASGEPEILGKSPEHYGMTYYTDGQVYFYISSGGNNAHTPMTSGEWHHVAGTFDGKKLCLYIDGELKQEIETQYPAITTCEWNVVAGKDPNTAGRFAGIIDEVKIYSRALSADEVKKAYAAVK
ncbi:MAG: hypothetical protein AUJ92_08460 [Armatimonadetes bacterium CG2_30_59_28]|nr:hypothetical protein [Armatimonadota bacterium]OIO95153.1 MAG: hypothetical protein AUJ92_08460 [Armatimonadetes bacterium CG2_30_59_28]PIU61837.1 MAG: hypothetical protein COS85_20140 [Armatimonadetes bacterium CG07_land_8_20_14_0_80_59_28]PIX40163.1 MAG: hypothetical protein COZ56_15390 [Armatimonadetes bacterium CG_4_8_14_3_um_filter_58_9]PIY46706.1 MAG: hypothetical protein COZ05_05630 [Armatimonadetes bacterium CG_4_10_14_3_um_filter_59_10]PJB66435.1 MAG: hypothetical protein CO095_131